MLLVGKKVTFRFLHRIARIDPVKVNYHHIKTPLSFRRSFVTQSSQETVFSQARQAFRNTKIVWFPIPVGLGIAYIAFSHYYKNRHKYYTEEEGMHTRVDGPLYIRLYASLPLRYLSQLWGYLNDLTVPMPLRSPLYKFYSWVFDCKLEEMEEQDLQVFENLGQFFYRRIRKDVRTIADKNEAMLVSPADGRILHCGVVEHDEIEQVKGITYSLNALLGPNPESKVDPIKKPTYLPSKGKKMYFLVVYLAPGDYHRFHSPTEWKVKRMRHFAGEMFSVSPSIVSKIRHLFSLNERVSLLGEWKDGFFAMVPVAATNVGKIVLNFAPNLLTNVPHEELDRPLGTSIEEVVTKKCGNPIEYKRGEEMGGFKLGSTLVLVFEAHDGFEFKVSPGEKVKLGQAFGK